MEILSAMGLIIAILVASTVTIGIIVIKKIKDLLYPDEVTEVAEDER